MTKEFPEHAQIVVIGGGIIGCSTAYHLAKMGATDVVLIEQYTLSAGSTWHAAGAVGQLRSSANITKLLKESVGVYEKLEEETGLSVGWVQNGSLRLATNKDRRAEFEISATMARSFGIEFEFLSPGEVKEMVPQLFVDDLECAAYVPSDGVANPSDIAQALAKGGRDLGVKIFEHTSVEDIKLTDGRVSAVETSRGTISCEYVVNAAGIWAREIGAMVDVGIPIQPSHHQYLVTDKIPGLARHIPTIRDTDSQLYFKEEVGGLAVGVYEFDPIPFLPTPIPDDHQFKLMPENIEHFELSLSQIYHRVPDLETVGVKQWFNGIEAFTEDGMFIVGEAPGVKNFFVSTGFNAFGIASGGGVGKALAYWILNGEPPFDLWSADIRRFGKYHGSKTQVMARSLDGQAQHYAMHWPHLELEAGRPLRLSAIYQHLKENGACFGSKLGWERPNWFAPEGVEATDEHTFGRPNWFKYVAEEHRACRESVAVFDLSSFAKFMLVGIDAEAILQHICAANVARPEGSSVYSQILNKHGGIEADVTVTRLASDRYLIISGTGSATRDFDYIKRSIPTDSAAHLFDVTSAYGCLSLMGPSSPRVMGEISEQDIGDEMFPMGAAREIFIDGAPVIAMRVSFVGERGWELHIPTEYMVRVYRAIKSAGADFGIRDAGYRAIDSLRLEKARRVWGHDINPDYTPFEAGLGFAVDLTKPSFVGREALLAQNERGVNKRLVSFSIDDPDVILYGRETIYRNDTAVGWLTSAGFGHTTGKPIGLGYVQSDSGVDADFLNSGNYELEVRMLRHPANMHIRPIYDPKNERVR
ncbi:MAG: FAD-dependent oxidoreductase [Gammaproteobacteria bacterium]|nr:FAD-dependent oxidoreductase [Gammaproteobacteria bacterium]